MASEDSAGPSERDFEAAADRTLRRLEQALSDIGGMEADLESGILTLEFDDGDKYVINSHRAARQIWMAAERNAWHFDLGAGDTWTASKSGEELWGLVERMVTRKLDHPVALAR
ncbi:MAG: iron donor protein CyaY [Polyangiaceae bacterium]